MSHPLISGFGPPPPVESRIRLNPPAPGTCPRSFEELQQWIEQGIVETKFREGRVMYATAGPVNSATTQDHEIPRFVFDDQGRWLGLALWMPEIQNWSISGAPGEIRTIKRTFDTVEQDMREKLFNGWFVCDASIAGAPDLTPQEVSTSMTINGDFGSGPQDYSVTTTYTPESNAFFVPGDGEEWDIYSVIRIA